MGLLDNNGWRWIKNVDINGCLASAYEKGELYALVSKDDVVERGVMVKRWHISVSAKDRYPNWDEICAARYDLLPDECYMAQMLPPKADYVNVHPNCFHLHEIPADVAR